MMTTLVGLATLWKIFVASESVFGDGEVVGD